MPTGEEAAEARDWLRERFFDVVVEEKDRREELIRAGYAGLAAKNHTHWAHLVSVANPDFVVRNYGSGKSEAEALIRIRRRYGSEQE
jgi:hypothetical protein